MADTLPPDPAPPAPDAARTESAPLDRAKAATRIVSGELTREECGSLWATLADKTTADKYRRVGLISDLAKFCIDSTMEIVSKGDAGQREALSALVRGELADASSRFEEQISAATEQKSYFLRLKSALFIFIDSTVAVDALTRAVAIDTDDQGLLWAFGRILQSLGQLERADLALRQLLELERQGDDHNNAAKSLVALADIAQARDDPALAATRRRDAVVLFEKGGDDADAAAQLRELADDECLLGEFEAAETDYKRAVAHYEKIDYADAFGDTLIALGGLARQREATDEAIALFERARDLAKAAGSQEVEAEARYALGLAHAEAGRGDEGIADLERAASLFEKLGKAVQLREVRREIAGIEARVPKPPPPPSEYPANTREYFWDRIIHGYVTDADAGAMLDLITRQARASMPAPAGAADAEDDRTLIDFKEVVLDVNVRADPQERVALSQLVECSIDKAVQRYETIVQAAVGDIKAEKLWSMGALFVTTAPQASRDAWQRLLAVSPDFHYARCAYGRLLERMNDVAGAEVTFREVFSRADGDPASQAMASDFLGELANHRGDDAAEASYMERSLQLYRQVGDDRGERITIGILGEIACRRGDVMVGEAYFNQALKLSESASDTDTTRRLLKWLVGIATQRGDGPAAARLSGRIAELAQS
jgi:tetratricopeptide (TPR) repeat protein